MAKIALGMIVKADEPSEFLFRCLNSAAPFVDAVYLTLNGPEEKETKEAKKKKREIENYALEKGFKHINCSYTKWEKDFSKARNFNFSLIPSIFDYILWLDVDDILRGGNNLKSVADQAVLKGFGAVFFNYLYRVEVEKDQIKNVLIEHLRERLIKNDGSYKWIAPIHETLVPQREVSMTDSPLCDVVHLSNDDRAASAIHRNIEILERQLSEQGNQQDPRTIYYLAKAYFDLRTPEYWKKAEEMILKYLDGSPTNAPSGWAEERAQAYEYLAEMYREGGLTNKAKKCIANALLEDPKFPNFYIDMALIYMYAKDWVNAKFWAELAQHVPYPKTTLVTNPKDMKVRTLEVLFNVALNTNNLEEAFKYANMIAEFFPDSKEVQQRAETISKLRENNMVAHKVIDLARYLNETGQASKLEHFVKAIPSQIEEEPVMIDLIRDFTPGRVWEENEVAIMCGRGFEKWSPKNIDRGIGGSEEAVIYLSKELAKVGWRVSVYGDPQDEAGTYDGVNYVPFYKFNPKDKFNIFIGWRSVPFFDNKIDAKKRFLWLHDIQNPVEYTPLRVDRLTKIFALSKWHRDNLPNVPDEKFMITGNGINLEHFEMLDKEGIVRDPYRIVYTSSYDRGLEHLLKMWPDVKAEVPQATLHICYGWNLFETFYRNNPERMAWKEKMDELMKQDGITHLGRVSQVEVLRETYKAGIWAYPTHFGEISCITAMKCQAAGAVPVVCGYAALKETVQFGVKVNVDENDIYDPDTKREFKNQLVKMMKHKGLMEDTREQMVKWARDKFSWTSIAKQWDEEFRRDDLTDAADVLLDHNKELNKYLPVDLQERLGYEQTA